VARHDDRGQASVELLAVLPALLLALLIAAQIGIAGHALWSAGVAARAGARAAHVGGDAVAVARRALPEVLRQGAEVSVADGTAVRVFVPVLVPGLPRLAVRARTALGAGNES
jgi:uncharacterized protein (UPF0333 family)